MSMAHLAVRITLLAGRSRGESKYFGPAENCRTPESNQRRLARLSRKGLVRLYNILYHCTMAVNNDRNLVLKEVAWIGSSKVDLSAFPDKAKGDMGYQIHLVQKGEDPDDWKPLKHLGKGISGVNEIRLSSDGNIYRTAYVAKFGDRIAVLHCWQKKTQTTTQSDKDMIVARYREAKEELS